MIGRPREDLEETSVPTFGLSGEGTLTRALGDYAAALRVRQSREVELSWARRDGRSYKAIPAEVKRDHAGALKEWRKLAKDIEKMLGAQRIRIERLLMTQREWQY